VSRDAHLRERLKSFGNGTVVYPKPRIEWKEEKWKVRGCSRLPLVRAKCRGVLCIVFALRSAWCDARVVMTVPAICVEL